VKRKTKYVYLVDRSDGAFDSVWTRRHAAIKRRDQLRAELRDKSWHATRLPLNRRCADGDIL
jgi:hypothetical protein